MGEITFCLIADKQNAWQRNLGFLYATDNAGKGVPNYCVRNQVGGWLFPGNYELDHRRFARRGCVSDDILVSGRDAADHLANLERRLQRLDERGLRCRIEKGKFAMPAVEYLGHEISQLGIAKGSKVDAVLAMPASTTLNELHSYLGLIRSTTSFCRLTFHRF